MLKSLRNLLLVTNGNVTVQKGIITFEDGTTFNLQPHDSNIAEIRIVLDSPDPSRQGQVTTIYWGYDVDGENPRQIHPELAHAILRKGIPYTIAVRDPSDRYSHYEASGTMFRV